jgi:hypothetical protein
MKISLDLTDYYEPTYRMGGDVKVLLKAKGYDLDFESGRKVQHKRTCGWGCSIDTYYGITLPESIEPEKINKCELTSAVDTFKDYPVVIDNVLWISAFGKLYNHGTFIKNEQEFELFDHATLSLEL